MARHKRKNKKQSLFKKFLFRFFIIALPLSFVITLTISFYNHKESINKTVINWIREISIHSGLTVQDILVEGRNITDEKSLLQILDIEKDTSIFLIDLDHLSHIIYSQIPWVIETRVKRKFPNQIHIVLKEITPLARWEVQNRYFIIGKEKTVAITNFLEFEQLPLLRGTGANEEAQNLINLVQAEPLVYERLEGAERIGKRRWNLHLKNGIIVMLPDTDEGYALSYLSKLHQEKNILNKNISHIDMRLRDRLYIKEGPPNPSIKPKDSKLNSSKKHK